MKINFYVLIVICTIIFCACNNSVKVDLNDEEKLLRVTTDSLLKALNSNDAELLKNYYDKKALFFSAQSGLHNGKDDIKNTYSTGFALPGFYIKGSIQEVNLAKSADIGYTLIPWEGYFIKESGDTIEQKGLNLLIWKKQENGTWRVKVDKP